MYVTEGGYNDKPDYWKERVTQYVKWAGQLGVYCLIDWHVMNPGNPSDSSYDRRFDFFKSMTLSFANTDHVLYEIANEPNNVQWSQVQTYAEQMIQWIRRFDSNTIIIIGTP
jgi:aryl-phospho-beta-D-glucosidase BglC (GH1 family)